MKKVWLLVLLSIPFIVNAQTKNFIIEGKIGNWDNPASISLTYTNNGKPVSLSSTMSNGKFKLQGQITDPAKGYLTMLYQGPGKMGDARMLWIEAGHIKIFSPDSLQKISITGSKLNTEDAVLLAGKKKITDNLTQWFVENGQLENNDTKEYKIKYDQKIAEINLESKNAAINFIKAHPDSYVSLAELNMTLSRGVPDITEVDPLFNHLSPAIRRSPQGKAYQQKLENWKKVDVGSIAPDFTQPDTQGNQIQLSSLRGKYVLLDFWASWCHPCREEHPNLIRQYKQYKSSGFEILSVSLDGGNSAAKEAWMKAIEKDGVGIWKQVSDLTGSAANEAVKKYGVGSIPENFLIDPNGKIIAKSLRGDALNKKLKELFEGKASAQNEMQTTTPVSVPFEVLNQPLPLDASVRYGKLGNGFTYYIKSNAQPKDRVLFYLANKAGSILEDEDQRGLAHFMEHMNFNGTAHFPKNELVNYLQKQGVRFGADINAYTGFDETVYQLPLPSNKPEVLKNGFLIMKDWAQGATLDPAEINKERGVILEEKRMGKGAAERMRLRYLPLLLNQSRYAQRLPIGNDTVLENFKPQAIRSFYQHWYRPDLQALIVVGDIDVDQIEKEIRRNFSTLVNPLNEPVRTIYTVPLTGNDQFIIVTDDEQITTSVEVIYKHREPKLETGADYRNYIMQTLFNAMISYRLQNLLAHTSVPPFIAGRAGIGPFLGRLNTYSVSCTAKPGELENGFKTLWQENEKVKRYGFIQTELDREKRFLLSRLESTAADSTIANSEKYVNAYLQHFLKGAAEPGILAELDLAKKLVPTITLNDVNFFGKEYMQDVDRDVLIMAPELDKQSLPGESKFYQWMKAVEQSPLPVYEDMYLEKPFFNRQVQPGKIVKMKAINSIKALEWTLSNGATVIVKPTAFMANDIAFAAFAPGGNSLYSDEDYPSAAYAAYLLNSSGIGDLNGTEMNALLGSKKLGLGVSIGTYSAGMNGLTSVKELETFFQFINMRFAKPRLDTIYFQRTIAGFLASLANRKKSPEAEYYDTISATIMNGNIRGKPVDSSFIKAIDLTKAYKIYNDVFSNAANFTFTFAGDIDTAVLKPLVEKYLASLPANNEKQVPKNLHLQPPAGQLAKIIYKGIEQKAKVNLTFSGAYNFNETNNKLLEALKEILQIKLLERLREKESGVYSPSVAVVDEKIPEQRYRLRIAFDCSPDKVEALIVSALDEVGKIISAGPDEIDVDKFKAEDRNSYQLKMKSNDYWVNHIIDKILNGNGFSEEGENESILNNVTQNAVQEAAKKYLRGENLVRFILMPAKYEKSGRN